mmetsp:Transcript_10564/g.15549  ORF Transcript_10564/g.15549 Transcript_10564/m.15549 type:complete len:91 (+) Transcript_10564:254-526(+)
MQFTMNGTGTNNARMLKKKALPVESATGVLMMEAKAAELPKKLIQVTTVRTVSHAARKKGAIAGVMNRKQRTTLLSSQSRVLLHAKEDGV